MERVSGKLVRPCPPPSQGAETWKVGDTVEVFEHLSWKVATILKVMQGDYYTVRLLGCSKEYNVHKLNIREQCLWLDDKWILMGKKSGACGVIRVNKLSSSNFYQQMSFQAAKFNARTNCEAESKCLDIDNGTVLQESHKFSRSLKRLPWDSSSVIESLTGKAQKIRAVEKDARKQKVAPPSLVEKGRICRHASLASQGLKVMLGTLGFAAFSLAYTVGHCMRPFSCRYDHAKSMLLLLNF